MLITDRYQVLFKRGGIITRDQLDTESSTMFPKLQGMDTKKGQTVPSSRKANRPKCVPRKTLAVGRTVCEVEVESEQEEGSERENKMMLSLRTPSRRKVMLKQNRTSLESSWPADTAQNRRLAERTRIPTCDVPQSWCGPPSSS